MKQNWFTILFNVIETLKLTQKYRTEVWVGWWDGWVWINLQVHILRYMVTQILKKIVYLFDGVSFFFFFKPFFCFKALKKEICKEYTIYTLNVYTFCVCVCVVRGYGEKKKIKTYILGGKVVLTRLCHGLTPAVQLLEKLFHLHTFNNLYCTYMYATTSKTIAMSATIIFYTILHIVCFGWRMHIAWPKSKKWKSTWVLALNPIFKSQELVEHFSSNYIYKRIHT